MELLLELFLTAFVALCFSFLVAKLVSIAMVGGDVAGRDLGLKSSNRDAGETVVEEVKLNRGLKVEGTKSKKRVRFVVDEVVRKVDEFRGEGSFDEVEVSRLGEEFVEKCCDAGEICDASGQIDVEESFREVSEVVGLPAGSPEADAPEIVREFESHGVEERNMEGLVVEEESIMNNAVDGMIIEEKIGNDEVGVKLVTVDVFGDQIGEVKEEQRSGVEERLNQGDEEEGLVSAVDGMIVEEKIGNDEVGVKLVTVTVDVFGDQIGEVKEEQGSGVEERLNQGDEEEGLVSDEDDDWEGIERSELEKVFAMAADYVGDGGKDGWLSNLEGDVQMQLYGLHKVAMEGPCHEAQPMALKVSARAKWNAWQRLGNMSPEVAMEQYINLISNKDPGWMQAVSAGDGKSDSSEAAKPGVPEHNISTFLDTQPNSKERKLELKSSTDGGDLTGTSNSVNMDKE